MKRLLQRIKAANDQKTKNVLIEDVFFDTDRSKDGLFLCGNL